MITGISIVSVPVDDTDQAIDFYCRVLGMEKRKDIPMGDDTRYVEVAPPAPRVIGPDNSNSYVRKSGEEREEARLPAASPEA